ncbi:two-component system OmpR family response regulator [Thermocatellispora tengchongensis]|uniref:Two-component system OmpR family response regulator n=1 Tax=Thermocatellispora tengchongensis TaxID=1073253 RepID=A0A840PA50_9ACTN|nr:response regulator transcription factor [Thermocatellispora tengchongensis]MBB5134077.1 two-component system OmpR family response regulator [Thermocatellispora tengchongensis]
MDARILVVDDEPNLADLVAMALRYEGFEVAAVGSGGRALALVPEFRPDLIVLDIMLPDISGMEVCRRLKLDGVDTPVVFLTAKDATEDKVGGLMAGGDDYVTKPFSLEELIARVRVVLRRTRVEERRTARLAFADLEIDEEAYEVRRGGLLVELTPTEYKLLRYLLVNAGRVLTKRQILDHVWEYDFGGNDGVVQTYVSYLRRKVDAHGPPLIHTVPRVGYVLRLPRTERERTGAAAAGSP